MSDSIFVRVQRVVSGGVGSAMDAAERLSGASVMRQAIREMDSAIERARTEREAARARRLQAEHHLEACRKQLATLKEQAQFAVGKQRLDLAEVAVGRQLDVESRIATLAKAEAEAKADESRLGESVDALKLRRAQMFEELRAFEAAQRAASTDFEAPGSPDARVQRRAERAEEAFERALAAAGGLSGGRASPEAAAAVAELEALQKEAAIAERLAALSDAGKPAGGGGGVGKRRGGKAART
ncbi:MAG TPA: PspA/IM30 family protein [Allosphingosinicella sp.]|jgi:phage shock protein A